MMEELPNPHGKRIEFGKHSGELFTRLPVSYIRWMINTNTPQCDIARAEFARRGDTMPSVELSGHAIDSASLRVMSKWTAWRKKDEGLYSWLQRVTLEAINEGKLLGKGQFYYKGMIFIVQKGEEFPVLKTIMKKI